MDKGLPATFPGSDNGSIVAAPLLVQRGPAGALVIETPARVEPTEDDLELLALFSSQAAVVSSPCELGTGAPPVWSSRNAPVPYVFFASPALQHPWPKSADCW